MYLEHNYILNTCMLYCTAIRCVSLVGKENYDPTLNTTIEPTAECSTPEPDSTTPEPPEGSNDGSQQGTSQPEEQWPDLVFDPYVHQNLSEM